MLIYYTFILGIAAILLRIDLFVSFLGLPDDFVEFFISDVLTLALKHFFEILFIDISFVFCVKVVKSEQ